MGTAARIRALRVKAGKSQAQIAKRLELNPAWCADLERHDDELASTLTMFKAMELASILGVSLYDLLEEPRAAESIALVELPDRLIAHAKREGLSVEQLGDRIGWELREFIDAPVQSAAELPILFFQAVAAALGINWLALVPDEP